MIDHDRLFKELLSTFSLEFLDLFVPDLVHQIDRDSLSFLPQEYFAVLEFNFVSIQLNLLNWQDYLARPNPVATALMAKMQIDSVDRPKVKAECLRLLVTLQLNPARTELISGFIDTYLRLGQSEERVFEAEIDKLETEARKSVMQIVTSWMEKGIEQGIEQGERSLILRLLNRRLGIVPEALSATVNALSLPDLEVLRDTLLDFESVGDLEQWLAEFRV